MSSLTSSSSSSSTILQFSSVNGQTPISRSILDHVHRHISWQFTQKGHLYALCNWISADGGIIYGHPATVNHLFAVRPVSPVTWGAQHFFRNSQSVIRTPWLRRRVHAPTSKSSSQPIAGTTGTVRLWSIITALVSTRPCEPWKVKDNLCRHKIKYFYGAHIV
jgi:hypothetical protein